MKVKLLSPLPGYSHFEGEVINLPDKVAKAVIEKKLAEPVVKKEDKDK